MITGHEIREARLLVRWNLEQLARAARLPLNTVMRAELLDREAVGTAVHTTAIRSALETAGVDFISENGGGAGVEAEEELAMTVSAICLPCINLFLGRYLQINSTIVAKRQAIGIAIWAGLSLAK